jgi:Polyketide cyclase / dehydrase and lipid transport
LPLGAMGGRYAHGAAASRRAAHGGLAMLLPIPPSMLVYDTHAQPSAYAVKTTIEIAAPSENVWQKLINLSQFPAPHEWYFHTGLAYPTSARIDGIGPGATRYCEFSAGSVVETIEVWNAPHILHFRVTETPAPMRERNPFGEISPKHLHGYKLSHQGEFHLTPLTGNRTLLEGTSRYQHGLWPVQYWRLWSDAVVHRIHLRVFQEIRRLSEHA